MQIINSLIIQLETILSLMKKDLGTDSVTYDYYIKEVDYKFLNIQKLNIYLSETQIENSYQLEKLNNLCIGIRNLWNSKLGNPLRAKELKEWVSIESKDFPFCGTKMDFHVLFLQDDKCITVKIDEVTPLLLKNLHSKEYNKTDIHKIVKKCGKISNTLTNSDDSLISKEDPEQWLIQYQNFKSFRITAKPYKTIDYDKMTGVFEDHLFNCRYIFLKLVKAEQQEFKKHVIENLTEILEMQILPEFKDLFTTLIFQSENDFAINSVKAEYPFTDGKVLDNFKTYTDKFIVEPYVDYSYLFQRLKNKALIENITHVNFMTWLKDKDFIKEKVFDLLIEKGNFRTLNKSSSTQRENNFNNVFS